MEQLGVGRPVSSTEEMEKTEREQLESQSWEYTDMKLLFKV